MEPHKNRNAPCWCGSGLRYKHCHGRDGAASTPRAELSTSASRSEVAAPSGAPIRDEALAAHRAGSLGRAEELYRRALVENPSDVDVLHMLGVVQLQRLRHREALDLLLDAAERTGWDVAAIRHNLGLVVGKLTARDANERQAELVDLSLALERQRASVRDDFAPLVSVVLWADDDPQPGSDLAAQIEASIESVLVQNYRNLELIVVDGRGGDVLRELFAQNIATAAPEAWFRVQVLAAARAGLRSGTAVELNRAIGVAQGVYVALLRAGDVQDPERISALVEAVARRRARWGFSLVADSVGALPSPAAFAPRSIDVTTRQRLALGTPPTSLAFVETNVAIVPGNLFFERVLFDELGGFRNLSLHWDWEFCLRAAELAEPVVVYRPLYGAPDGGGAPAFSAGVAALEGEAPSSGAAGPGSSAAAQILREFLGRALTATDAVNPLAPQHPANRLALLKLVFRANLGALVPAQVLRAFALEAREREPALAARASAPVAREAGKRTAIVVLGMHRSGTSAVARVLSLCGAALPVHVKPARLGVNAKGFWEPEAVLELDSRLMQQLGGEWDRVDFVLPDEGAVIDEFLSDASNVLSAEYGDASTIVIKDPRIGVLAPLWQRALHDTGFRSAWVVPIRNPLEVARSLHARGDMGVRDGLALWLAYAKRICGFSRGRSDVIFFTYEELLTDWRAVVTRIRHRLEIPLDPVANSSEADRFLDREMRHQVAGDAELAALFGDALIDDVRAVYRECLQRCVEDAHGGIVGAGESGDAALAGSAAAHGTAAVTNSVSEAAFVLCIENNGIRDQALLLCESLRRYGGRHRHARIVAFAPRPGLGVDRETRARLADLAVDYVDEPLNTSCPAYAPANRVFAGARAEALLDSEWVAVFDSDTLVLDEIEFPSGSDAVFRPVDEKGSATRGPGDPFEPYWMRMAELAGVDLDRLPRVRTTITGEMIRASYNAGFALVRRRAGILTRCAQVFAASLEAKWRPYAGAGIAIHASTGDVGSEGSEFWGSSQTALALAAWAATGRVHHATDRYNVPLHLIAAGGDIDPRWLARPPAHVHYHWMFGARTHEVALELLTRLGVATEALDWIRNRIPLRPG